MRRKALALVAFCGLVGAVRPADAAGTAIKIGYTPIAEVDALYVAKEEGIFSRHGLEVELVASGINSMLPAALVSGSVQIAGTSPTVFLQAVDGGLDLAGIANCGVTSNRTTAKDIAVVARTGVEIKSPGDYIGKKVGIPGVGATLHVLFRQWLSQNKVDPGKVTFIEVSIPNSADVLRSGAIDAVIVGEPSLSRVVSSGAGAVATRFLGDMPEDLPLIDFTLDQTWAKAHPDLVRAFQQSITEAAAFTKSNQDKTRDYISKYTKLSLEILKPLALPECDPVLKPAQLDWFAKVMTDQGMLQSPLKMDDLILPSSN